MGVHAHPELQTAVVTDQILGDGLNGIDSCAAQFTPSATVGTGLSHMLVADRRSVKCCVGDRP